VICGLGRDGTNGTHGTNELRAVHSSPSSYKSLLTPLGPWILELGLVFSPRMKKCGLLAVVLLSTLPVVAQEDAVALDDVMQSAEQWAKENLDEEALRALQGADQEKVKKLFAQIQQEFQSEYVVDVAALKDGIKAVLPLLEGSEDTLPYALWLKARLDYLEVADQFRCCRCSRVPRTPCLMRCGSRRGWITSRWPTSFG
jgi:hypothetical protein